MKFLTVLSLGALLALFSGCASQPSAITLPAPPLVIKTLNGENRLVEQPLIAELHSGDEVLVRQGTAFIVATVGSPRGEGVHRLRWPHSDQMKLLTSANYAGRLFVVPKWAPPAAEPKAAL